MKQGPLSQTAEGWAGRASGCHVNALRMTRPSESRLLSSSPGSRTAFNKWKKGGRFFAQQVNTGRVMPRPAPDLFPPGYR